MYEHFFVNIYFYSYSDFPINYFESEICIKQFYIIYLNITF